MLPYTATAFYNIAELIGDCVAESLGDRVTSKTRRAYPVLGLIAWDDCHCDGLISVALGREFDYTNFPQELGAGGPLPPSNCYTGNPAVDITLEWVSCWPGMDDRGNPPTAAQLASATAQVSADRWAIRTGLLCCLEGWRNERVLAQYLMGATQVTGPEGNCVSLVTQITVGL
jgi:hypothetical protein